MEHGACWRVFIGEAAGKNFPISSSAVKIVIANAEKAMERIRDFNSAHGFREITLPKGSVETDWPKPL